MKRLTVLGSLFVLGMTAQAQNTADQQVVIPASKAAALQRVYVAPDTFKLYQGAYSLSNGKTLHLTRQNTRMYARVEGQRDHEITTAGNDKFMALDGQMAMSFENAGTDDVRGELTYVDESPAMAGVTPQTITIRLAAR